MGDLVPVSVALQNTAQMTADGPSRRYVSAALRKDSVIEMIYACTEASCTERVRARHATHALRAARCRASATHADLAPRASQHGIYTDVFVWHHMLGGPGIVPAVDIGIQPTYMTKGNLHHQGMARINIHNQVRQLTEISARSRSRQHKPRDRAAACPAQIDFGPKERRLICIVYLRALRAPNAPTYVFHLRLESDRDVSSAPPTRCMEHGWSSLGHHVVAICRPA